MQVLDLVAHVRLGRSHTYNTSAYHDLIRKPRTHQLARHRVSTVVCMADKQSKHELKQVSNEFKAS